MRTMIELHVIFLEDKRRVSTCRRKENYIYGTLAFIRSSEYISR